MYPRTLVLILTLSLGASLMWTPIARAGGKGKIAPVPPGMSFEEYQDAHRSLAAGLLWTPIPGGLHFYANDNTRGWILAGTAAAGVLAIIVGAASSGDG
ncbi:MAG: hypothetical protein VYE15_05320, partial [Myxococcota bacterium]|nr:hypothetical protein [Myxococcota bacterium]